MVFLTAILPPQAELEFINIIRIKAEDVYMF